MIHFSWMVLLICFDTILFGQGIPPNTGVKADTSWSTLSASNLKMQPVIMDSNFFSRSLDHIILDVELKPDLFSTRFYNPEQVFPSNPLMTDYRSSSYYTPKIVSDRLNFIMNRPRADSFVPIPVVAILAANLALKYVDIERKIELTATDYLIDERLLLYLKKLWIKSPRTTEELYGYKSLAESKTFLSVEADLSRLLDKRLIKRRKIEAGQTLYYPSQSKTEIVKLIETGLLDSRLTSMQRSRLSALLTDLKK